MIDCRGRNKWFKLHEASASLHGGEASVRMSSKKPYMDMPPIYFSGPVDEVLSLLDNLKNQILAERCLPGRECGGR